MKIGVVTWNGSYNYGTNLQAFALYKYLESLGHQVDMLVPSISDAPALIPDILSREGLIRLRCLIQKFLLLFGFKKDTRLKQCLVIRKYIIDNFQYIAWNEISDKEKKSYDMIIAGSDQIWNPNVLQTFYLLDFVPLKVRKCSYASSFGVKSLDKDTEIVFQEYLPSFSKLSVREKLGAEILAKCVNKPVSVVPDPTFLFTKEQWTKVMKPLRVKSPYVLCYFVGDNKDNWKMAMDKVKMQGYHVVAIRSLEAKYIPSQIKIVEGVGPFEFLYLIKSAEMVYTDSFHAMVFSILFNTKFCSFLRFANDDLKSQNSRIYDLLNKFNLQSDMNKKSEHTIFNWDAINEKIAAERYIGVNYLNDVLNGNM